jgi:hypothetical protein
MNHNFDEIDNAMNELDKCGDKHCGHIITSSHIKEMEPKVLRFITKKCRSKKIPKTEEEDKINQQNYNKCYEKFKKHSKYSRRLTKRKKCEDKKCKYIQEKIKKILSSSTRKKLN